MKTKVIISKDGLMAATLIGIKNVDSKEIDVYVKYANIYSNHEVDIDNSTTDNRNVDELADEVSKWCDKKGYNLYSY